MCTKLPYNNPRIDECIRKECKKINDNGKLRTLSSCCGHKRYPKTIVVMQRDTKQVYELFSGVYLGRGRRKGNRYYKRDPIGHYFIPEVFSYYLSRSDAFRELSEKLVPCLLLYNTEKDVSIIEAVLRSY